jgi:hypothetical protein
VRKIEKLLDFENFWKLEKFSMWNVTFSGLLGAQKIISSPSCEGGILCMWELEKNFDFENFRYLEIFRYL